MTKRLLRSVIEFDHEVTPQNLLRNFERLRRAVSAETLTWGRDDDQALYRFVEGFIVQYGEPPSSATVLDCFKSVNRIDITERVEDIATEKPYARTNFVSLLRGLQEDQARVKAHNLLKETNDILMKGKADEKTGEVKRGLDAALEHWGSHARSLRVEDREVLVSQDARSKAATDALWEEYERAEANPGGTAGAISGIHEMDEVCRGIKPGELWIHGAFPGELKTTLALNWAYNACTRFKRNVVYISLEMPQLQMTRQLACLHSSNRKFPGLALDYGRIKSGELTAEERTRYREVLDDWGSNPTYTTLEIVTPPKPWTMEDIEEKLRELHREFEVGLVILDHGQWIEPRKAKRRSDYVVELNSVVDDAKRLALTFDDNRGLPVLLLWQINREGKDEADKNNGVYRAKAFTYANNVEKTADVITTTYLNADLRRANRVKITNVKNRDNPLFPPFEASTNLSCRRIHSQDLPTVADEVGISVEEV